MQVRVPLALDDVLAQHMRGVMAICHQDAVETIVLAEIVVAGRDQVACPWLSVSISNTRELGALICLST